MDRYMRYNKKDLLHSAKYSLNIGEEIVYSEIVAYSTLACITNHHRILIQLYDTTIIEVQLYSPSKEPSKNTMRLIIHYSTKHQKALCTFNTQGWKTKMTKDRIQDFSPFEISQEHNKWYINSDMININTNNSPITEKYLFFDGMSFPNFHVRKIDNIHNPNQIDYISKDNLLSLYRRIDRYAKRYKSTLRMDKKNSYYVHKCDTCRRFMNGHCGFEIPSNSFNSSIFRRHLRKHIERMELTNEIIAGAQKFFPDSDSNTCYRKEFLLNKENNYERLKKFLRFASIFARHREI